MTTAMDDLHSKQIEALTTTVTSLNNRVDDLEQTTLEAAKAFKATEDQRLVGKLFLEVLGTWEEKEGETPEQTDARLGRLCRETILKYAETAAS